MKKLFLFVVLLYSSAYSQWDWDADKRVAVENGWQTGVEFLQFYKPWDPMNTSVNMNNKDSIGEFSTAGGSIFFAEKWVGQGVFFKNTPNLPVPDYVTLEVWYLYSNNVNSVNRVTLNFQIQSQTWTIAPSTNETNPLNGSKMVYTWDLRSVREKLSPGIIRVYLLPKTTVSDSCKIITKIGVRNLTFIYSDGSKKVIDFDFTGTDVQNEPTIPEKFELSQNYPNPFNPTTKIRYSVPIEAGPVTLKVYELATGKEVATLVDGEQKAAGIYEVNFDASNLASGRYFYTIQSKNYIETKKMILMK
ncbi:MAG: T9SS type A sorting domain-containing protein [Burkholderiales bacterium]|nr:T9SS type A sorting domain-containing protein [Burkholderiales bacterium]